MNLERNEIPLVEGGDNDAELTLYASRRIAILHRIHSSKEEKELLAGYDLGVDSYIEKPADFDQLREILHTAALYWLQVNQPPPRQAVAYRTEQFA